MHKTLAQRLADIQAKGKLYRTAGMAAVDTAARTAELSFSSETEFERWFGVEVLDHSPAAVRMGRINDGAPLLWMHDLRDQRGVIESARIDGDRNGRALVRFSKSPAGEQLMLDAADGIVTKVSVGYVVHNMVLKEQRGNDEIYLVTDWEPYEISLVSVPADTSVGLGRSSEIPPEETPPALAENPVINTSLTISTKGIESMKIITLRAANGDLVRAEVDENGAITKVLETIEKAGAEGSAGAQRGLDAERSRAAEILALGDTYAKSVPNARELAAAHVRDGKSSTDFQRTLLEQFNQRAAQPLSEQGRATEVGLSDRDVRRYSFMTAIRALSNPNDRGAQEAAAFEIECSVAAQRALGKTSKGILIPPDVLARAFNAGGMAGSGASGANLVQHEVMTGSFIDLLRNRSTIMKMATVIGGLVGTVDIPKQTGAGQAYWLGEGQDATETGMMLGQLTLTPKTLGAYTDITRRLSMQSTPDAEGLVRGDLLMAVSQEVDRVSYYGLGTEFQPRGLKYFSGINAVDFATQQKPTFSELVQMETEISADNADIGNMGYVGSSRFRGHAKTALRFPGVNGSSTIWEQGNTVNGYRTEITNQLNADDVFFGNFADFIIAMWGGLDLTVDPYSLSKSGGLRIVVFQDIDTALRRVESICWGSDKVAP